MRFLDAVALAQLKNLRLKLRRHRAEGHLSGRHRSLQFGFAQEFAHHREYVPGDELKFLDWRVSARKDRLFIKQFQEDVALQTYLCVDASGSMAYQGAGPVRKWEHACSMAEGLAYLVLALGDAVGLVTFHASLAVFLPPGRQLTHLQLMDSALEKSVPQGKTDLAGVLRQVAGRILRRSLIVVISDLLGDTGRVLDAVKALRAQKHEVCVLQVLDPMERDLSLDGPVWFESMEDFSELRCEASLLRREYRQAFERQQRFYEAGFHRAAVPYAVHYTDSPWPRTLAAFAASLD